MVDLVVPGLSAQAARAEQVLTDLRALGGETAAQAAIDLARTTSLTLEQAADEVTRRHHATPAGRRRPEPPRPGTERITGL